MNITTTNNNLNDNNTTNLVTSRARVHNQLDANHGSYKIFVNTNLQDIQDTLTNTTSLNSVITLIQSVSTIIDIEFEIIVPTNIQ